VPLLKMPPPLPKKASAVLPERVLLLIVRVPALL
jgi:hypothetical protein